RAGRRVERADGLARAELPLRRRDGGRDGHRRRSRCARADARARGAGPRVRARRRPRGLDLPGDDADQRDHADVHSEDRRDRRGAGAVRPVDADAAHGVHHDALLEPAGLRPMIRIPDPTLALLARVAGLVVSAPMLGHALVPVRVRAAMAALLAFALVPAVAGAGPLPGPA